MLFVVIVQGHHLLSRDSEVTEQLGGMPRVLAGNDIRSFEALDGPEGDVAQISNRGGNQLDSAVVELGIQGDRVGGKATSASRQPML